MISTKYHTDDFYQRMLDMGRPKMLNFGQKGMGTMNSGICHGGPLHGHPMHHPEDSCRLAVDQHTNRSIPGMVASADPFIKFGTYRFADGIWTWHE